MSASETAPAATLPLGGVPEKPSDADEGAHSEPSDKLDAEKQQQAPAPPFQPPAVPDGGLRAWSTVAGAWLVLFCTFGYVNAFGVFEAYYLATTGESASNISWIGGLQLFMQFSLGAITGPLFDRGYFRSTLIFGSVLYVFALFMTSIGKTYWEFLLAQGVAAGIGIGLLFLPTISVIAHHFGKRRALASGIVVSGSSTGGVVFPIMLNRLINGTGSTGYYTPDAPGAIGFGWAVRATAFLILGLLTISVILMRDRFKEIGINKKAKPDVKGIFKDPVFQFSTAGYCLIILGLFIGFFFVQVFAQGSGIDPTLSFYTLAIVNAASIFGRTIPNFLADKIGPFNIIVFCGGVSGVLCLVMPAATTAVSIIVWSIFYGFFSGSYISLLAPCTFGSSRHPSEIGVRLGLTFLFLSVFALVGTPILGALLGNDLTPETYHWWHASVFAGVIIEAGVVLLFCARTIMARRKGTQKV